MNTASTHTPTGSEITAVILAAGSSRRMGKPKMLLPWGSTTVIGQVTGVICAAGILNPVIVTGRQEEDVRAATAAFAVRWVYNPDFEDTEMLQSLQIGLRQVSRQAIACLIVLGDQPQIERGLVDLLVEGFRSEPHRILIPSYQQRRGHPWLVRRDLWDELLALPPDANLRVFLNRHAAEIHYLNVATPTVLMDLDTPEDYARSKPGGDRKEEEMDDRPRIINWQLPWDGLTYRIAPLAVEGAPKTLDEVSLRLPAGAYTTFRTYGHTHAIRFQEHLDRLVDSAQKASVPVNISLKPLRAALHDLVRQSPFPEARVRISLDLTRSPGKIFVSLEELHLLPMSAYETGVRTVSRAMHRNNPQAKLTNFIATAAVFRAQLASAVNEMLMISDEGIILEGLSSNFFGVKTGVLYSATEGVLFGITRSVVLELARENEIPVDLPGIRYLDWSTLDECFITSASRGVLPVIQIDEHVIGKGQPGAVARCLMQSFSEWVQREAEEI